MSHGYLVDASVVHAAEARIGSIELAVCWRLCEKGFGKRGAYVGLGTTWRLPHGTAEIYDRRNIPKKAVSLNHEYI